MKNMSYNYQIYSKSYVMLKEDKLLKGSDFWIFLLYTHHIKSKYDK